MIGVQQVGSAQVIDVDNGLTTSYNYDQFGRPTKEFRPGDDPETVIRQSGLELTIYPAPIRVNSLIQAVRSLAGS